MKLENTFLSDNKSLSCTAMLDKLSSINNKKKLEVVETTTGEVVNGPTWIIRGWVIDTDRALDDARFRLLPLDTDESIISSIVGTVHDSVLYK